MLGVTRNILILNMAASNILLCMFTMPLSLMDLIHTFWPLDYGQAALCYLINSSQAGFVFFSCFSVILIAFDRYLIIVNDRLV